MSVLSVETAGLQSLAGVCASKSVAVSANAAASAVPASSFQPSAAAVSAVHTAAGLAGATLSGPVDGDRDAPDLRRGRFHRP